MSAPLLRGVIAAAATPLREDFSIDLEHLVKHCAWLLQEGGCDGVALLGTTGEATSFSAGQRLAAMRAIAESGLPPARFFAGTGAAALEDAADLTRAAVESGFAGALLLPPFYFKDVDVARFVRELIRRVGSDDLRLYLYHYPALTGVPYTAEVMRELLGDHAGQILGLKDSTGDLEQSAAFSREFPTLDIFPCFEGALPHASRRRFAGCISGTLNLTGPLVKTGRWEAAAAVTEALARFPLFSAIKSGLADFFDDSSWCRVCPPLRPLDDASARAVRLALEKHL